MGWKLTLGLLGIGLVAAAVFLLVIRNGQSESSSAVAGPVAEDLVPLLRELAPGTTYHALEQRFRRHGPAAAEIQLSEHYLPETSLMEVWITFDAEGNLDSYIGETRGLDGTVYARTRLDGSDLVHEDAAGNETMRIPDLRSLFTVDTFRTALSQGFAEGITSLESRPHASDTLDGRPVEVLEDRRDLNPDGAAQSFGVGDSGWSRGYSIPFTEDLRPVQEIRRYFMLADEKRQVKSAIAVVDVAGVETVIETTDELVFEVLTP